MTIIQSILSRLTEAVNGTDKELYTEDELNKFATFYLDKWDENTSEDVIAESFTDFWWDTDRTCRRSIIIMSQTPDHMSISSLVLTLRRNLQHELSM